MTADEFTTIRKTLGLSQRALQAVLGYAHREQVAQFETRGTSVREIPPLLERLMRAYEAGYRPDDWPGPKVSETKTRNTGSHVETTENA